MGAPCAKCSDVEKAKAETNHGYNFPPDLENMQPSDDEKDDGSEVVASSDGEADPDEYKHDVERTLKATGENLKRGKTMAMKEAITTAKKIGVDQQMIENAEMQLDEHFHRQKRDAVAQEVVELFESKHSQEIPQVEKMLKKARDADCEAEVIERLERHLETLIVTRPLASDECDQARDYMRQSCLDFVKAATKGEGRPVVFLNLSNGKKISATLSCDAVLQNIVLALEDKEEKPILVPVLPLAPAVAESEVAVRTSAGFKELQEEDVSCAMALRYEGGDGKQGFWCFIEPTPIRRDRLIEALLMLTEQCKVVI